MAGRPGCRQRIASRWLHPPSRFEARFGRFGSALRRFRRAPACATRRKGTTFVPFDAGGSMALEPGDPRHARHAAIRQCRRAVAARARPTAGADRRHLAAHFHRVLLPAAARGRCGARTRPLAVAAPRRRVPVDGPGDDAGADVRGSGRPRLAGGRRVRAVRHGAARGRVPRRIGAERRARHGLGCVPCPALLGGRLLLDGRRSRHCDHPLPAAACVPRRRRAAPAARRAGSRWDGRTWRRAST